MKRFNVGALRAAINPARLSAVNDLVQRTLAKHGLAPNAGPRTAPIASLETVMAQFGAPLAKKTKAQPDLPAGATFNRHTFTCQSGSRSYQTYVPSTASNGVNGVIVMLHGCTQNPTDFAAGTGMNALAQIHGFVVVYPEQSRGDNAQSCWNWFSRGDQQRGRGEPAIIAALTRKICSKYAIGRDKTFVAGLSAGAAMAVILGETYPDVFDAIGAHSGLPYGAAKDVASAFAAMAGTTPQGLSNPQTAPAVRTIIFHGTADATVHPANGERIMRRILETGPSQCIQTTRQGKTAGRGFVRTLAGDANGPIILEHWAVSGLGHAWSGGQTQGSYTDPTGPDASAEMVRFFFNNPDKEI